MRATNLVPIIIGLLLSAACTVPEQAGVGGTAPAYAGRTLAGEPVALRELRGEVVLLNVWATWCYPCRKEMPSLEALHRDFSEAGLRVVAVSIDQPGAAAEVGEFLEEHGITFTVVHDAEQQVTRAFGTIGVPETYLIDREGVLVKHWIGLIDGHSEFVRGPVREALAARMAARE